MKNNNNNQPHGKLWLVEHKNYQKEFVFHLSRMHLTRLHKENVENDKFKMHRTLQNIKF